jgi:hypothetical protein
MAASVAFESHDTVAALIPLRMYPHPSENVNASIVRFPDDLVIG